MARETSIEAYYKVEATGLLSTLRAKVLKILAERGPMTANEMRQYGDPNANSGVYSTRLSELERMGVVQEVGKRACRTTGHTAIEWDLTGDMPVKFEKDKTRKELKEEILADIIALGEKLPMTHKQDLRDIYHTIKDL